MKKSYSFITISIFTFMLLVSGCGSQLEYPSINNSGTKSYNYGQVVWRDLVTPDPKLAADFYKKVFGWTSIQVGTEDQQYWIFKNNGKPVGGMFLMSDKKKDVGGEWIQYYSVNSVEDIANKCKTDGGTIAIKPFEMPGRGNVALISDPQKALFAVIKSSNGDPSTQTIPDNEFLWSELWSNDTDNSESFYKKIFNSTIVNKKDDERSYIVLENNGKPSSGIIKNPAEKIKTNWVQYIRVSNVSSVEQKAKDAGGRIIIPSDSSIRNGTVCVIVDPTGAPFAIQKWDK
ncbi:MAG TPA: VOC family protein [Ignavibacteria bacterium]|nr:VOC family protein [Ignavibacteria bacterium]